MPTECNITFENADNVFYGGQLLIGHVELSLTDSKNVRGIFVEISGLAHCHWTTGTGDNRKTYNGDETYLNERTYFVGGRQGEITIQPGHYTYDFQCNLPLGLPTSLEHHMGHIRYKARVVLDRPMWPDQEYEKIFTVIKPLNLNFDSSYKTPDVRDESLTFLPYCFFCCCPSDPMHIRTRIPVTGYTPGQMIIVEIEVDNKSDEAADFNVQLWKRIDFYARGSSKHDKILVIENDRMRRCYGKSTESYRAPLLIPPIPPTDFNTGNICKVQYMLRIDVTISGCCKLGTKFDIPITIGTYPILDEPNTQGYPTAPSYNFPVSTETGPIVQQPIAGFNRPSAPGGYSEQTDPMLPPYPAESFSLLPQPPSALPNPSAPYPESDPPTYEQAMATKGNEADDKRFRPNYPVYRRATSYSSTSNE